MATILERVGALLSANINWLLDKAMQTNSPAMLDAYVRKLEDNREALKDACATIGGNATGLRRKAEANQTTADMFDEDVDNLLKAGREDLAGIALSKAKTSKRTADLFRGNAAAAEMQYEQLKAALAKMDAKITLARQKRDELVSLLDLARAKEVNLSAYKSVNALKGLKDPDFDKVVEGITTRLDKAEAAIQLEGQDLDSQMEEVLGQTRDQADLEARKKKLGLT